MALNHVYRSTHTNYLLVLLKNMGHSPLYLTTQGVTGRRILRRPAGASRKMLQANDKPLKQMKIFCGGRGRR
jgi:hypothetical protein